MEIDAEIERFVAQVRDELEGVPAIYREDVISCLGVAFPQLLKLRVDVLRNLRLKNLLDETEGPVIPEQVDYMADISHVWGKVGRVLAPRAPVTSEPCPVCAGQIRSDEREGIFHCSRCLGAHHEACFWRVLPLEDFLEYWSWLKRTDDEICDEPREDICAACREREATD